MTTSSPLPRQAEVEAALPLLLKQLKLARFRSHWQPLSQQAEAEGWSPSQFLYALCEQEVVHRQIARRQRLLRDAHLPWQLPLLRIAVLHSNHRPTYHDRPLTSTVEACEWVPSFSDWYEQRHRLSWIKFVKPRQGH